MTIADTSNTETSLFTHACACCGDPIAVRHEVICEAILALDAMEHGTDIGGEFTTRYCPACLIEALELNYIKTISEIGQSLDFTWENLP